MIESVQAREAAGPSGGRHATPEPAAGSEFQQQLAAFWPYGPYGRPEADPRGSRAATRQPVREASPIDTASDAARRRRDR